MRLTAGLSFRIGYSIRAHILSIRTPSAAWKTCTSPEAPWANSRDALLPKRLGLGPFEVRRRQPLTTRSHFGSLAATASRPICGCLTRLSATGPEDAGCTSAAFCGLRPSKDLIGGSLPSDFRTAPAGSARPAVSTPMPALSTRLLITATTTIQFAGAVPPAAGSRSQPS